MFEKRVNHNYFWAVLIILASMGSSFALADQTEVDKATAELKVLSESLDANDINNTTNDIRAEYLQLKSIVEQESDLSEQVKTFDEQAINLLTKWRNEAPKDVVDEISNLKKGGFETRIEAIARLARRGADARGAALDLVELMGSSQGRQPPELLFWKPVVEESSEAANALIEMNEVGAIALVYAFLHNFDGISLDYAIAHISEGNPKITSYTNRLVVSHEALEKIFSLPIKQRMPREYWVALWSLSNPDDFVRKVSTPKVESNKPSWYKNEFLLSFVVGAILWFGIKTARNR